ncbi:hypothetical protein SLS64_011111 [Diaporthe eres]
MKLVVVGGTGLVATELIRQGLRVPEITSLVALARRPVQLDVDASDASKFESVVVHDYAHYSDSVKAALAGADACIWTVGITLGRSNTYDFAEVKHVCQDCTMAGLEALREANSVASRPGQTEKMVQDFGRDHKEVVASMLRASNYITNSVANVDRADLSAALLDQVTHGFEKEILSNADLVRIGGSAMAKET